MANHYLTKDAHVVFESNGYKVSILRLYETEPVSVWVYKKDFSEKGKRFWIANSNTAIPNFSIGKQKVLSDVWKDIESNAGLIIEVWTKTYEEEPIFINKNMDKKNPKKLLNLDSKYDFLNPTVILDKSESNVYLRNSINEHIKLIISGVDTPTSDLTDKYKGTLITAIISQMCMSPKMIYRFKAIPATEIEYIPTGEFCIPIKPTLYGKVVSIFRSKIANDEDVTDVYEMVDYVAKVLEVS